MTTPRPLPSLAIGLLLFGTAAAQCGLDVVPGFGHNGPSRTPDVVRFWDPDGPGPLAEHVFVGGAFAFVGSIPCSGAALYDPASKTWTALPTGPFDAVRAAVVDQTNGLLVAGSLGQGAQALHRVARWDGATWTVLGGSFDSAPRALEVLVTGEPVAGGAFQQHAGQPLAHIRRWDGTAWQALGGGVSGAGAVEVTVLHTSQVGELIAGGTFDTAGAVAAANIARWDGASWNALGAGMTADVVALTSTGNGDVFAAATTASVVRRWDGAAWTDLTDLAATSGAGAGPWVGGLGIGAGVCGEGVVVVGEFSLFGQDVGVALWEQTCGWTASLQPIAWTAPGQPTRVALDTRPPATTGPILGRLALAAPFVGVTGRPCNGVALIDTWQADTMGDSIDGAVRASASLPGGDLLIGGSFRHVQRRFVSALARGDGAVWDAPQLGGAAAVTGVFGTPDVRAIEPAPDGSLLLAGSFTVGPHVDVARFDGATWSGFGPTPFSGGASCVVQLRSGAVFVGGNGAFRRDPGGWMLITNTQTGMFGQVATMAELPNGDLVAGGALQQIPGNAQPGVMRWDGQTWSPLGGGPGGGLGGVAGADPVVVDCAVRDDGALFVVGSSTAGPFVARFDGTSWLALPAPSSGAVRTVAVLPDGDVVVAGQFTAIGGVQAASLARWNGAAWTALGDGVRDVDGAPGDVFDVRFSANGELQLSGAFVSHDGEVSVAFSRLRATCPALAQPFGPSCGGAVLAAAERAWLGSTMRTVVDGLGASGLALEVLGLAPAALPLPLSGCTLWVRPDQTRLLLPTAGTAASSLPIPSTVALLGAAVYQQVVDVELTGGALTGLPASNRLQHTIGRF